MMKRVVITGLGVVSCLGNNQQEVYDSLISSKSGISFSEEYKEYNFCLLYTSPSPRDRTRSRMPSSA